MSLRLQLLTLGLEPSARTWRAWRHAPQPKVEWPVHRAMYHSTLPRSASLLTSSGSSVRFRTLVSTPYSRPHYLESLSASASELSAVTGPRLSARVFPLPSSFPTPASEGHQREPTSLIRKLSPRKWGRRQFRPRRSHEYPRGHSEAKSRFVCAFRTYLTIHPLHSLLRSSRDTEIRHHGVSCYPPGKQTFV